MSSAPSPEPGSLLLLLVAVAVLGLGPLLFKLSRRQRWLLPVVDGFVLASVGALAALFVIPAAIEQAGGWALLLAGAGLLLPTFLEKVSTRHRLVHGVGIALALVGLLAHTITDGVALVTGDHGGYSLAFAVILHRIPVGLAAWWIVRPLYGVAGAWTVIALEGAGTVVGFSLGESQLLALSGAGLGAFQAFVAGALLHVVIHRTAGPPRDVDGSTLWRRAETLGAVLGAALVALVPHRHVGHGDEAAGAAHLVGEYTGRFLDLALASAPALLVGYVFAGLLVIVLPSPSLLTTGRQRGVLSHALRGTTFGIPLPICSCGVLPVYQGLIRRGVAPAAAMAFLVATPQLGVESLLLSIPLLGGELTVARLVAAMLVALLVGLLVGGRVRKAQATSGELAELDTGPSEGTRLRRALEFGMRVVDETGAWVLVGLAVAAAIEPSSLAAWFARFPIGSDVVVATLVGLPLYVCAAGATPLAAALLLAGMSPGAALAFLLSGPATNMSTLHVLSRMHGRGVALAFAVVVAGTAIGVGLLVNGLAGAARATSLAAGDARGSIIAWGAFGALGLLFAVALLRQGPRRFLANVLSFGQINEHEHEHHHDHDHDHDQARHAHDHPHHHSEPTPS